MKIVTYNIQFGLGKDGRFDPERVAGCTSQGMHASLRVLTVALCLSVTPVLTTVLRFCEVRSEE